MVFPTEGMSRRFAGAGLSTRSGAADRSDSLEKGLLSGLGVADQARDLPAHGVGRLHLPSGCSCSWGSQRLLDELRIIGVVLHQRDANRVIFRDAVLDLPHASLH